MVSDIQEERFFRHFNNARDPEITKFVDDVVFGEDEYIFFDSQNNAYCTKCHSSFTLAQRYRHNDRGLCPACGSKVTAKSTRYGRGCCTNEACFYYFSKSLVNPDELVCSGFYVNRSYQDYYNPYTRYELMALYVFKMGTGGRMLRKHMSYFYGERFEETSTVYNFNQGWLMPKPCYYSKDSLMEAIKGTGFQYIPEEYLSGDWGCGSIVQPIDKFAKHPILEQVYKIGFKHVVDDIMRGYCTFSCLNYKGRDVFKTVRLNRKDVKEIRASGVEVNPLFLKLYQIQQKDNSRMNPHEVKLVENKCGVYFSDLSKILKYTTLQKAIAYMNKQVSNKLFKDIGDATIAWKDYFSDCITLKLDIKDPSVLFPKNLHKAHQNTIKQVTFSKNYELDAKIKKRYMLLDKKYHYEHGNLILRPASCSAELIYEGKAQNICIGGYTDRYANGRTDLFFIRKKDNPDTPYYAMEICHGRIIQTRGLRNCSPSGEALEFVEAFEKWLKNKEKNKEDEQWTA